MADAAVFLSKAISSLSGADSEFANGRYDSAANRAYYCCFQAAIFALLKAGITTKRGDDWGHGYVQAEFAGVLIRRRKLYPSALASTLPLNLSLRETADYEDRHVSELEAFRAIRRAREFVSTIQGLGGVT